MMRPSVAAALGALLCSNLWSMPERTVSVGVGAGVPEVVFGAIDVAASRHWQLGFSYGIDGGLLGQALNFDKLRQDAQTPRAVTLADGRTYLVTPKLDPLQFTMISPSVRFFPTDRNFYLQLSWTLLRLASGFTSGLADPSLGISLDGVMYGSVNYLQHMPTLSVGHVWASKAFFFNIRLGASMPFTTTLSVTAKAQLPVLLGTAAANQAAIQGFADKVAADAVKSIEDAKKQAPIIPSIALTAGFFL